ncbi:MAG: HaeIII family restriction endonuclease [Sulfurimonas sp.]|uniref:HaeIII family restriction endonuclease n=1 Tax=Sulfurimonas sp. TaxID=2022749 RepID=UPI0025CE0A5F|nr:HaeIII family restriction endonuclease [Sulfurimonas sp.]MCK9455358.1 HaeIII family restriction endonuclease [Sulfurimonas sp.]
MKKESTQTKNGKAFEYAILKEFKEKLERATIVEVVDNHAFLTAQKHFNSFDKIEQGEFLLYASFAVNFLIDIEPRLSNNFDKSDILQLEILTDEKGQDGDVRDVVAIRLLQKWEIGISAKNNHKAVKHSRLSNKIDFGDKWLGIKASKQYFDAIKPIFDSLEKMRNESNKAKTWKSLGNYHSTIYTPILEAFKTELLKIYNTNPNQVSSSLVEYLIGNKDFYKVIKGKKNIEIQAYNLRGTLNLPFENINPKLITPKIDLPTEIKNISYKKGTLTTLIVELNNEWTLSFRIHNASSRVEPSLKFDINLLKAPNSLFTNKLSIEAKK